MQVLESVIRNRAAINEIEIEVNAQKVEKGQGPKMTYQIHINGGAY